MSTMKRYISLLLVLGILLGVLAPAAQAAPVGETATVDTDNVTIEGANGFGDLLAQEITENQQETETENEEYPGGYTVTNLEIVDNVATVTYDSLEEAQLVVALYTEDGMQLLTSATVTVTPDATETTVTFEGEMPEYFMASAYLLDQYDYSPLCASYDTPMYTREMQELLASTVDDYDPEKVLNLDEDKTTNFAVYADSTVIIEPVEGKNSVASIDDENAVYVIENADEQIASLAEGDVFVYPYAGNEILIIKVASISLDGTTATITGAELEMNDVFSHVKIESTADAGNAVVHEGTGDDCVAYNGVQYNGTVINGEGSQLQPNAWEDDITLPMPALEFGIEETFEDAEGNKITISGGMKVEADISLQYYIALFSQYVKFQIDTTSGLNFTVAGTVELFEFELPEIDFDLVPQLVSVGSKPQVEVSFNGEIGWEGDVHFTVGFACGHNVPNQDLCTGPWVESKANLKVGFAVKIDLQPNLSAKATDFLELISARVTCPAGFEVIAEENGQSVVDAYGDQGSSIHTCQKCLKFEMFGCVELGAEIVFLDKVKLVNKGDGLSVTIPFKGKLKVPILSAYYSTDYKDFGFGSCPYESYRLTIEVLDSADQPVQNTSVYTTRESWGDTNKYGILATYVPEGTYELYTVVEEKELSATIQVSGPDYLKISPDKILSNSNPGAGGTGENGESSDDWWDDIDFGDVADGGAEIESGTCGENVYWMLYDTGLLVISGTGKMTDFMSHTSVPWYTSRNQIDSVRIENGVTTIGDWAFYDCVSISSAVIGNSVTIIGYAAFSSCDSLSSIEIPDGVSSIGEAAFSNCNKLSIVKIGDGVTTIGDEAFRNCDSLSSVEIGNSVTTIGDYAFYSTGMNSVKIPDSVTTIGNSVFAFCRSLSNAKIGNSVTTIGERAFYECTSLSYVEIPNGVTTIGSDAFNDCDSLSSVKIPDSVTSIRYGAFYHCDNLSSVEIGNSVTTIGDCAFKDCISLGSVEIPDSVTAIGSAAFKSCDSLSSVVIPNSITTIDFEAFADCDSLSNIVIPDGVNTIGNFAFAYCDELTEIVFCGNVQSIYALAFYDIIATAYYPANNPAWTAEVMQDYGGTITWVPYMPTNANTVIGERPQTAAREPVIQPQAVFGGDYTTEVTEGVTYKTAAFSGLVPGAEYVMLALVSMETDEPLSADNLLAIDQGIAAEDGTLSFRYIQRTPCDLSYVFVCGASSKNLNDAEITFPEMIADGDLQVVDPTVVYDGKTLTEGRDYVITGKVDFTEAGEYTCYIRGIRNYTGLVECRYTVKEAEVVNPFTDVPKGSFFYDAVMWAVKNDITNGTSATTFGPNDQCMRAHVVTFLWRAVGSPEPTQTDNPFVDVKPTDFYYKPVLWALENGITSGMDATHFGPTFYCNRAQVVTFLYRTMGSPTVESAGNPFADVPAGQWYTAPVLWAVENGITNGLSATTFGPNSICNRAQIVTFLCRAFVD